LFTLIIASYKIYAPSNIVQRNYSLEQLSQTGGNPKGKVGAK